MSEPTAEDIAAVIERQIAEVFAYPEYAQWLATEPEVTVEVVYGFPKDTYTHQVYAVSENYYREMADQQARQIKQWEQEKAARERNPEEAEALERARLDNLIAQMKRELGQGDGTPE